LNALQLLPLLTMDRRSPMPNGGMLPCCQVCQWARASQSAGQVFCQKHLLTIHHSHYTFCSLLSKNLTPGLEDFITSEHIAPETIYTWIEIGYQDPKYPGLPMYHQEYAILTSVKEYAAWTEEQDTKARRALDAQVLERLRGQGKDRD
jgi:hypothetical protein